MKDTNEIQLIGCRQNNLRNIDVSIPYSKIVTFIGVSGSGKTTLVFDTLFAEGKRRYIESLGVSEGFFLSKLERPDADLFLGLPPAIALAQSHSAKNRRSTAGTISQAAYYVQILFARCGTSEKKQKEKLSPSAFNLNSPSGVCTECGGEGVIYTFDETLIWPDQELSFAQNGIRLGGAKPGTTKYTFMKSFLEQYGCSDHTPIREYPNELKVALLYGQKKNRKYKVEFPGIISAYEKTYKTTKSLKMREEIERYMKQAPCSCCQGTGYKLESLQVTVGGKRIDQVMHLSIEDLKQFLNQLVFEGEKEVIFSQIIPNLYRIIDSCLDLGIGYLSLDRKASSLSGGEFQRLHLVAQITSQISGVVYVLDEPSSGMHTADIQKLLAAIRNLNQTGNKNTIVMVEHTRSLINASDYVFELGPGAGNKGGQIVAQGTPEEIQKNPVSLSGKYLSGECTPGRINPAIDCDCKQVLRIVNADSHNLKHVTVEIPLQKMICITGVSGSGKTSLLFDAFLQSVQNNRNIHLERIDGLEQIGKVVLCDQSPISGNTRSCPATYLEFYQLIREKFARTEDAKKKRYGEKYFSYNLEQGQCPKCRGNGFVSIDMAFLPDVEIPCDQCGGQRFKDEILSIRYRGKNIFEILEMDAQMAAEFFADDPVIARKLNALCNVGLEYLRLGQPTSTLSGGEAQRLKLAFDLSRPRKKHTMFVFDEPSRGLHFEDVKKLLQLFRKIVQEGNTVLLIEHNLDIISTADYVIDLGPYAGSKGGEVCGQGTPRRISMQKTPTGIALAEYYAEHLQRECAEK